jgi:hypothetical protein
MERVAFLAGFVLCGCVDRAVDDPPGGSRAAGSPGEERLAIAWDPAVFDGAPQLPDDTATCPAGSRERWFDGMIAQDVELAGDAENGYIVDLDAPPQEALMPSGNGLITLGVLYSYLDGNGNRQLDPRDPDGSSPDQVVGTSSAWHARLWGFEAGDAASFAVYYAEGEIERLGAGDGQLIEPGWQIVRITHSAGTPSDILPISTPIPVHQSENVQVSTLNCRDYCWVAGHSVCPPAGDPSCLDDGAGGRICTTCTGCSCGSVGCP